MARFTMWRSPTFQPLQPLDRFVQLVLRGFLRGLQTLDFGVDLDDALFLRAQLAGVGLVKRAGFVQNFHVLAQACLIGVNRFERFLLRLDLTLQLLHARASGGDLFQFGLEFGRDFGVAQVNIQIGEIKVANRDGLTVSALPA